MSLDREDWTGHPPEVDEHQAVISWRRWGWVVVVATTTWFVWHVLDGGARLATAAEALIG
jgi:hypothetical protein